jgi:hypothetical protein
MGVEAADRTGCRVTYIRQGDSNEWEAAVGREPLGDRLKFSGVVSESTAYWEGESPDDANHYQVSVILGKTPPGSRPWPEVARAAFDLADPRLLARFPGAVIHRDDDEDLA